MKLETTIIPRRDGTVRVTVEDSSYVFAAGEYGALVAEVGNERHVAHLIQLGDFLPADEADFEHASALAGVAAEGEADDDDDESDQNAPPIEEPASAVAAKPAKAVAGRKKK